MEKVRRQLAERKGGITYRQDKSMKMIIILLVLSHFILMNEQSSFKFDEDGFSNK